MVFRRPNWDDLVTNRQYRIYLYKNEKQNIPGTELTIEKEMLVFLLAVPEDRDKGTVSTLLSRK